MRVCLQLDGGQLALVSVEWQWGPKAAAKDWLRPAVTGAVAGQASAPTARLRAVDVTPSSPATMAVLKESLGANVKLETPNLHENEDGDLVLE